MSNDVVTLDRSEQRITSIETWLVEVPTRRPHTLSFGTVTTLQYVIVRIGTTGGAYGWGEAAVLGGPTWSEESAESVYETVNRFLSPIILGSTPSELARHRITWDSVVRGNPFAKAAVEMALLDLQGRLLDVSVAELLGGVVRTEIPLSWSLASGTAEGDVDEATAMFADGHRIFKIKVGNHEVNEDMARVAAIRQALGPEASLRVDANQGWTRRDAFSALRPLAEVEPALLEQPLPREDVDGLAAIQQQADFPIMADECLFTVRDAIRIAQIDAARIFALKVTKHGGLVPAMQVAAIARAMGIGLYIGCMIETGLGTAAYAQLGAATPSLEYGCELFGPKLLADDIVQQPINYGPGTVAVPVGAGIGVDIDPGQLERYARPDYYHSAQ